MVGDEHQSNRIARRPLLQGHCGTLQAQLNARSSTARDTRAPTKAAAGLGATIAPLLATGWAPGHRRPAPARKRRQGCRSMSPVRAVSGLDKPGFPKRALERRSHRDCRSPARPRRQCRRGRPGAAGRKRLRAPARPAEAVAGAPNGWRLLPPGRDCRGIFSCRATLLLTRIRSGLGCPQLDPTCFCSRPEAATTLAWPQSASSSSRIIRRPRPPATHSRLRTNWWRLLL